MLVDGGGLAGLPLNDWDEGRSVVVRAKGFGERVEVRGVHQYYGGDGLTGVGCCWIRGRVKAGIECGLGMKMGKVYLVNTKTPICNEALRGMARVKD